MRSLPTRGVLIPRPLAQAILKRRFAADRRKPRPSEAQASGQRLEPSLTRGRAKDGEGLARAGEPIFGDVID
jgi:hypothetical protein